MNSNERNSVSAEKFKNLNKFLDTEDYVLVHLDPKNKDLYVPEHLAGDPSITLKLSRYFRGNLELNSDTICAELLFGGEYFTCVIPYDCIWGCTSESGENIIWPESTPEEVLRSILETARTEDTVSATTTDESSADDAALPKKGHLRRVK